VDPANVRPLEAADALGQAEKEAEATKMALKRKIEQAATSDYQIKTLPTKLKIDPNDPEDVVSECLLFSKLLTCISPCAMPFSMCFPAVLEMFSVFSGTRLTASHFGD
jgi:hypothetical protein